MYSYHKTANADYVSSNFRVYIVSAISIKFSYMHLPRIKMSFSFANTMIMKIS